MTIGKAGGIISKLSHKKQGQNALEKGMAIRVPPNCVGSLLVAKRTMITEQYRPSLKFLKNFKMRSFQNENSKKGLAKQRLERIRLKDVHGYPENKVI